MGIRGGDGDNRQVKRYRWTDSQTAEFRKRRQQGESMESLASCDVFRKPMLAAGHTDVLKKLKQKEKTERKKSIRGGDGDNRQVKRYRWTDSQTAEFRKRRQQGESMESLASCDVFRKPMLAAGHTDVLKK